MKRDLDFKVEYESQFLTCNWKTMLTADFILAIAVGRISCNGKPLNEDGQRKKG